MSDPIDPNGLAANAEAAYPNRNGEELSCRLPLAKACALVIDDHADEVPASSRRNAVETLKDTKIPHSSKNGPGDEGRILGDLYEFVPVAITCEQLRATDSCSCGTAGIVRRALVGKGDLRRFDLILLDLSLGEEHGEDPAGYQLLPILRRFFPLIPIIAYTKYRDMGHIQRAFRRGASWFLSKEETHKLPAHHLELIENLHWEREWRSVADRIEWDLPVGTDYDIATKHLIWKTVEHMPGGRIYVRELRGGIGGAKTLHASREINGRYDRAAPVVIKIDDAFKMLLERQRYQRFIQPYLSNLAGRIDVPLHVGGQNLGAISYTYAGGSQGRRGDRREVLTLAALLQLNLPRGTQEIRRAEDYEELFRALLEETLRHIHSIDPRREPSEIDFPNLVFGESPARKNGEQEQSGAGKRDNPEGSAIDAYLSRMPPEWEIPLGQPLAEEGEGTTKVYVYDVVKPDRDKGKPGCIECLMPRADGLLHRLDLGGLLGPFYAEHRYFRPMQPLYLAAIKGVTNERFGTEWKKQWEGLWKEEEGAKRNLTGAGSTDGLQFTFVGANLAEIAGKGDYAEAVCDLAKWLTDKDKGPRKALEGGRIGIIHGDMNLGNVMVERERGKGAEAYHSAPWLIDFARTKRDWIALDYTQLELDLCMRLIRPDFFHDLKPEVPSKDWKEPNTFVEHFLETPWQDPPSASRNRRLEFVYHLMRQVRSAADRAGVRDDEYLASRVWQCLITHKILCGKWRKKKDDTRDPELQFRCVWSLKQAFQTARVLGWKGIRDS